MGSRKRKGGRSTSRRTRKSARTAASSRRASLPREPERKEGEGDVEVICRDGGMDSAHFGNAGMEVEEQLAEDLASDIEDGQDLDLDGLLDDEVEDVEDDEDYSL